MKKFMTVLFVLFAVVACHAADASWSATDASPWAVLDRDTTIDQGIGASDDSITVFKNVTFAPGYEYIIQHEDFSGGSKDSAYVSVRLTAKNGSGTSLYTTMVDTMNNTGSNAHILPIGTTVFGSQYTIDFLISNCDTIYIQDVEIWKRRAMNWNKNER